MGIKGSLCVSKIDSNFIKGNVNVLQFKNTLLGRSNRVYTTIVACTDDDDSVGYLNKWDKTMKNIDIVDDYKSEKTEVKSAQSQQFSFTFGDYVVKSLIGSIDPELDNLDQKQSCCSVL